MDSESDCDLGKSTSIGADSTREDESDDDVAIMDEAEGAPKIRKEERRPKVGTPFRVAFFRKDAH